MHQPVVIDLPRFTFPWGRLITCFEGYTAPADEWYRTTFRLDWLRGKLQQHADLVPFAEVPDLPAEWATTGYADRTCREDYARKLALGLKALRVDVVGVPAIPPLRRGHYQTEFLRELDAAFPPPSVPAVGAIDARQR